MTEIKKAIEYLDDACKESDEIISECSAQLQKELLEQKAHFVIALQALREKAENDRLREEGRLVVLPCAANGADLFFVDLYHREVYKEAYTNGLGLYWTNDTDLGDAIPLSIIGKTVFLTREEAEKALEGLK